MRRHLILNIIAIQFLFVTVSCGPKADMSLPNQMKPNLPESISVGGDQYFLTSVDQRNGGDSSKFRLSYVGTSDDTLFTIPCGLVGEECAKRYPIWIWSDTVPGAQMEFEVKPWRCANASSNENSRINATLLNYFVVEGESFYVVRHRQISAYGYPLQGRPSRKYSSVLRKPEKIVILSSIDNVIGVKDNSYVLAEIHF
jgi:hypothetical protein